MTGVVLYGTIRLDSKIRFQIVHFYDSLWRQQTLAVTKLFLSLTRMDFAVGVSSRARTRFSGPITSTRTALIRDLFSYGFCKEITRGAVRVIR